MRCMDDKILKYWNTEINQGLEALGNYVLLDYVYKSQYDTVQFNEVCEHCTNLVAKMFLKQYYMIFEWFCSNCSLLHETHRN